VEGGLATGLADDSYEAAGLKGYLALELDHEAGGRRALEGAADTVGELTHGADDLIERRYPARDLAFIVQAGC
jgi:hypothetical protein